MCQEEEEIFRDDDPLLNVCFFLHYLFLSIKIIFILCGNSFFFLLHSRDASQPLVSLDDVKIKKMFFKTFGNEIVRRIATIRKFVKNSPLRTNRGAAARDDDGPSFIDEETCYDSRGADVRRLGNEPISSRGGFGFVKQNVYI